MEIQSVHLHVKKKQLHRYFASRHFLRNYFRNVRICNLIPWISLRNGLAWLVLAWLGLAWLVYINLFGSFWSDNFVPVCHQILVCFFVVSVFVKTAKNVTVCVRVSVPIFFFFFVCRLHACCVIFINVCHSKFIFLNRCV